ncbi:hypothetical protein HYT52_02935 [Candidatus Woesearchaeota archaeon]|nr:hypothetical protein [Candidatus Woesearchaeota archaeon]
MSDNPYCYVSAEMGDFEPVSTSLVTRLVQKGANSVRLYGYRGAGKTAMLQAVLRRHEEQGDSLPVYVNLSTGIDGPIEKMDQLFDLLYRGTVDQLKKLHLGSPKRKRRSSRESLEHLYQEHEDRTFLYLIDSADKIFWTSPQEQNVLRGFLSSSARRVSSIMAGLFTMDNIQMDYASPLFNILETIIMEGLERKDAELLVREPVKPLDLRFDDEAIDFILGKSRPISLKQLGSTDSYPINPTYLPRDLQMLCHYTFQAHNPESRLVTIDEAVRAHQEVTSGSNTYNATRWAAFPTEVKSGLCKLAGNSEGA